MFYVHASWNDDQSKFSGHQSYHMYTKLKNWKQFCLWWELLGFTLLMFILIYSSVNYIYYVLHCILSITYYYKFVPSSRFSQSVVSDSLQPHEPQHTRPPCPSPTPGVHWDSRPLWRKQWHPTPVLLPGKSHGRRSLVGCSPWGR